MDQPLAALLGQGAAEYGVTLDGAQVSALFDFKGILLEWNKKMNLTAIEEDREVIIKHFLDSLSIIPFLDGIRSIVDVGSGAGFPGIPVKIARPGLEVVLLDSLEKRIHFLNAAVAALRLKGITAVRSRAEDAGASANYREKFDGAVARAVASLPVLLEYCLPLVKTGGIFLAMKGGGSEVTDSEKALNILGGRIEEVKEFSLPGSDMKRNIIVVRKLRQTPTKYPRKAGKPSKEPLI